MYRAASQLGPSTTRGAAVVVVSLGTVVGVGSDVGADPDPEGPPQAATRSADAATADQRRPRVLMRGGIASSTRGGRGRGTAGAEPLGRFLSNLGVRQDDVVARLDRAD